MTFQKQVVHNIFKDHPKIWQNSSLLQMFHVLDMNQSLKVKKKNLRKCWIDLHSINCNIAMEYAYFQ